MTPLWPADLIPPKSANLLHMIVDSTPKWKGLVITMRKTVLIFILLSLSLFLSSCNSAETSWPGYSGTMEGYEYCHTEERDRAWEEDILFLVEKYLTEHPLVTNAKFHFTIHNGLSGYPDQDYSNAMYDENHRNDFIAQVNQLIARIPELSNAQLPYEAQRIVASLEDAHSELSVFRREGALLPIFFTPIFSGTGDDIDISVYAARVPKEYEHVLGGKLTAINDVPIERIIDQLTEYTSSENVYWAAYCIADPVYLSLLTQKNALETIGVMEADADSAKLTFETESGILDCTVNTVINETYDQIELVSLPLASSDSVLYRYDKNYWCELLDDGSAIYLRISSMQQDDDRAMNSVLNEVSSILQDAEEPMKLIIDFRFNSGGDLHLNAMEHFASAVDQYETNGVYLLINGSSVSAALAVPYLLAKEINGAQLVGEPAAHALNSFSNQYSYQMPNSGYTFHVANHVYYIDPDYDAPLLQPDVLVYQTWEDYRNGIDTVLEYVLSLS